MKKIRRMIFIVLALYAVNIGIPVRFWRITTFGVDPHYFILA